MTERKLIEIQEFSLDFSACHAVKELDSKQGFVALSTRGHMELKQ